MADTSIEWADKVWNATRGCSRISTGCGGAKGEGGCYAERQAARFSGPGMPYEGLVRIGTQGPRWTGKVVLVPEMLDAPLHWRKSRRVFVNSMSDLFHEALTNEQIAAVFGVMAACPHTFQVLTKRAKRMREWFAWLRDDDTADGTIGPGLAQRCGIEAVNEGADLDAWGLPDTWPLPNVHLGVSVEDQATADERIPHLLDTPAAVRWVSYEPALGPVDFGHLDVEAAGSHPDWCVIDALTGRHRDMGRPCPDVPHLDWIVVGGESGPGARPFDLAWARSVITQCRAANTACFVKQLGSRPCERLGATGIDPIEIPPHMQRDPGERMRLVLRDRKGGDMREWPTDLRVRMWPGEAW